jgi:hypothetical protein
MKQITIFYFIHLWYPISYLLLPDKHVGFSSHLHDRKHASSFDTISGVACSFSFIFIWSFFYISINTSLLSHNCLWHFYHDQYIHTLLRFYIWGQIIFLLSCLFFLLCLICHFYHDQHIRTSFRFYIGGQSVFLLLCLFCFMFLCFMFDMSFFYMYLRCKFLYVLYYSIYMSYNFNHFIIQFFTQ